MAADAIAVADDAGVAAVDLIGASLGGMVAQELAIAHPRRVRTLDPRMHDRRAASRRSAAAARHARDAGGAAALPAAVRLRSVTASASSCSFVVSPEFAASCEEGSEAWVAVAGRSRIR